MKLCSTRRRTTQQRSRVGAFCLRRAQGDAVVTPPSAATTTRSGVLVWKASTASSVADQPHGRHNRKRRRASAVALGGIQKVRRMVFYDKKRKGRCCKVQVLVHDLYLGPPRPVAPRDLHVMVEAKDRAVNQVPNSPSTFETRS